MIKKSSWGNPLLRWLGIWDVQDLPVFIAGLALWSMALSYSVVPELITDKLWAHLLIYIGGALTIPILWNVYVHEVRKNHFAPFPWPWWRCPNEGQANTNDSALFRTWNGMYPPPAGAGPVQDVERANMMDTLVTGPVAMHRKQLAPIYDQFESDSSILIAKMDATVNELEHSKIIPIQSYPTIKLSKKGDNKVIEYSDEKTLEGLTSFLECNGEYDQSAPNEDGVVYNGPRTLEGLEDFVLGKEPKAAEEPADEAEEEDDDELQSSHSAKQRLI